MAGYGNYLHRKRPDSKTIPVFYHGCFMLHDGMIHRVYIHIVDPQKCPQAVDMVQVIMGYQHPHKLVVMLFDKVEDSLVHNARINDDRLLRRRLPGISISAQDITIAETEITVMKKELHLYLFAVLKDGFRRIG
jgi:hypothetical protein